MTDLIIDHVLIAVRDLDAAKDTFETLGFKVTPEGRHPGRGTSNRLVVFGGEYLELISVHDPDGDLFRPNLPSFLDSREGLFIFSMGTPDVHGRARSVREAGVLITDPVKGSRQAADGTTAYSWTQAEIDPEAMPGSQTFFIQHDHTIEERYTDPPDPTSHPNGVLGISSLSLAVKDADSASRHWTEVFGLERASKDAGCVRLRFDNSSLDFRQPDGNDGLADFIGTWGEGPYRIVFSCEDLDATEVLLRGNGVEGLMRDGGCLSVPTESAQGVRMSFVQA
ncbi:MAG: VOC family protein [Chloroflexi bacterium]|nr:VOC family protein [Chloroflexota bacterium]